MNETKLIAWLRARRAPQKGVLLGIGDDAALVEPGRGRLLLKADMIIEKVHFDRRSREEDWGRKALACNLSDIAAMGGTPLYALVSLGLPRGFSLAGAQRILKGILKLARRYGVSVVGGDTSRSERIVISVAVVGRADPGKLFCRSGARTGDVVFVTGRLGGSLRSGRHLKFEPRLRESRFLKEFYGVHAMIDVSDGLAKDLRHLAEESRVGMVIFENFLPLNRDVKKADSAFRDGEDFELAFTLSALDGWRLLRDRRGFRRGFRFYPIGRILPRKEGLFIEGPGGRRRAFPKAHDHHFGRS